MLRYFCGGVRKALSLGKLRQRHVCIFPVLRFGLIFQRRPVSALKLFPTLRKYGLCNLNINTGDFLSFADYFFDGFVVDWMVQDRINNARHQVEEAIRRTEYIINQLQHM